MAGSHRAANGSELLPLVPCLGKQFLNWRRVLGWDRTADGKVMLQRLVKLVAHEPSAISYQFRRVNGHLQLPALRAWLDATITAVAPS